MGINTETHSWAMEYTVLNGMSLSNNSPQSQESIEKGGKTAKRSMILNKQHLPDTILIHNMKS